MRALTASEIFGNWATCLLHIKDDESICFSSLESDIRYLIDSGVNGIYTNGTAGEFSEQWEAEFDRICEIVAGVCGDAGMNFQLGASFPTASLMSDRVKRAAKFKPGAIQFIFPDWFPLNDDERVDFLRRVAEAADGVSLVLYNPPHAKRIATPQEINELRTLVPSLVGVKTGMGDERMLKDYREKCEGMSVFLPGHHLATGIVAGCSGSYSNVACLDPRGAQRWFELCLSDLPAAIEMESRVQEFFTNHISPFRAEHHYSNAALDKFLAAVGGWSRAGSRLRSPYRSIHIENVGKVREAAVKEIPEIMVHLLSIGQTNFSA